MNLHAMANSAISAIHANEIITLYQADGQENMGGLVTTKYLAPQKVVAQVQCEGNSALQSTGNTGQSTVQKRFYLNVNHTLKAQGLLRQKERSGDIIELADGTFWLVTSMPADYSASGWLCLIATLQTMPPDFTAQDWFGQDWFHEDCLYEGGLNEGDCTEDCINEGDCTEDCVNDVQDTENTTEKGEQPNATEIENSATSPQEQNEANNNESDSWFAELDA